MRALAGGSADVAALLRILRDTYAPDLRDETLEAIGLEIGSDMPFCVPGAGRRWLRAGESG